MSDTRTCEKGGVASLDQLKEFSGRRIESERLRRRLSQEHLARRVGLSVRWLREIESGNPAVALDDHLRCAAALRLAPAFVLLPLLDPDYSQASSIDPAPFEWADIEYLIRSEETTSELQSLMRISSAVFCLKKNKITISNQTPQVTKTS